ncbi:hypothetical protein BD770DRAFT_441097 [Pilaira anomala]|nr:hypothetical protein BD770DRAFT_441097 [Pilaira anomala]
MSDRMSECTKTIDHLPPIENLPLRKRLGISIKKQQDGHKVTQPSLPLKKSWFPKPKYTGLIGNPLLWNNGDSEKYAPWSSAEDTIDSFKSAWLGTQEKEEDKDDKIDKEEEEEVEEKYVVKKSNSISSGSSNKRGRPSVSKRSYSLDEKSTVSTTAPVKVRKNSGRYTTEGKLYCVCRQTYDATRFMIACDRCDDWFHGECIHINEKESEFIDLYFCTKCSKATGKKTLWKPKCVNPACYKAARISSSLGHLSKYCSDSCGMQVARARLELVEMKRRQSNNSTHSMSIAKLTLLKQKQSRVQSFADKEDRRRLIEIGKEKQKIRDRVEKVNQKRQLLSQVEQQQDSDKCQFDEKLLFPELKESKKCEIPNCLKHLDWKNLLNQEYDQERKEQFQLLVRLQEEVNQIKSRMRKRRNEKDILKELVNGTISS